MVREPLLDIDHESWRYLGSPNRVTLAEVLPIGEGRTHYGEELLLVIQHLALELRRPGSRRGQPGPEPLETIRQRRDLSQGGIPLGDRVCE